MDYIINIAWHDGSYIPIQAIQIDKGLAIHWDFGSDDFPYKSNLLTITHVASGKLLIKGLPDISSALIAQNDLLEIGVDWTQGETEIQAYSLKWKIRDVMEFWETQIHKRNRGLA